MKHFSVNDKTGFFEVLATTKQSQAATMVLEPGQISGEYKNEHPESDQILYVIEGVGEAKVEEQTIDLKMGDTLVIEAGEKHQVKNTGTNPLKTLNFYAPPAY